MEPLPTYSFPIVIFRTPTVAQKADAQRAALRAQMNADRGMAPTVERSPDYSILPGTADRPKAAPLNLSTPRRTRTLSFGETEQLHIPTLGMGGDTVAGLIHGAAQPSSRATPGRRGVRVAPHTGFQNGRYDGLPIAERKQAWARDRSKTPPISDALTALTVQKVQVKPAEEIHDVGPTAMNQAWKLTLPRETFAAGRQAATADLARASKPPVRDSQRRNSVVEAANHAQVPAKIAALNPVPEQPKPLVKGPAARLRKSEGPPASPILGKAPTTPIIRPAEEPAVQLRPGPRRRDSGSLKRRSDLGRNARPSNIHSARSSGGSPVRFPSISPTRASSTSPATAVAPPVHISFSQIQPLLQQMFTQAEFNITHDVLVAGLRANVSDCIRDNFDDILKSVQKYKDMPCWGKLSGAINGEKARLTTHFTGHIAQLSALSTLHEIQSVLDPLQNFSEDFRGSADSDFKAASTKNASAVAKVIKLAEQRADKTLQLMDRFKVLADELGRVKTGSSPCRFNQQRFDSARAQLSACSTAIKGHVTLNQTGLKSLSERMSRDTKWYRDELQTLKEQGKEGSPRYKALLTRIPGTWYMKHYKEHWREISDICCPLNAPALGNAIRLLTHMEAPVLK